MPTVGTRRGGAVPRIARFVPGIAAARTYERAWLPKDVVAGLVLTALLVPQGMAYAELAGLPAITGLYTSIMCLLAYAVFGPSRILVLGPDSSLGPMIAATILPLVGADGDPAKAIALASMLALMVGACMIVAGICRLGFVADLFSKPTQIGYMNGLALTILVGQLPKLFGFSIDADSLPRGAVGLRARAWPTARRSPRRSPSAWRVWPSSWCRRGSRPRSPACWSPSSPASPRSSLFDLGAEGVSLVGELPQGFPPFTLPDVALADLAAARRPARWASPSCRSPTRSRRRRRSPTAPVRRSTPTRR